MRCAEWSVGARSGNEMAVLRVVLGQKKKCICKNRDGAENRRRVKRGSLDIAIKEKMRIFSIFFELRRV